MRRTALIILFLLAPIAVARPPGAPRQLPPCMPVDEMRMTHVVHVPQWPNFLLLRKEVDRKYGGKTILEKLPAPKPAIKVKAAKKKALQRKVARVKGCKPGRTKNNRGQCGRWK